VASSTARGSVSNFENLNPANPYRTKHYNLYAKVDSEAPRYLEFEQWWGAHVLLNAQEMQSIADQLFIGNKLATAGIVYLDKAEAKGLPRWEQYATRHTPSLFAQANVTDCSGNH
jgi:Protein of unknown function (DUF3141)